MSDYMETEPYLQVQFNVVKKHGTQIIGVVNCGLKTELSGLKEDLEHKFGIEPAQQHWYYNGKELRNGKTLWEYDFRTHDKFPTEITVKST